MKRTWRPAVSARDKRSAVCPQQSVLEAMPTHPSGQTDAVLRYEGQSFGAANRTTSVAYLHECELLFSRPRSSGNVGETGADSAVMQGSRTISSECPCSNHRHCRPLADASATARRGEGGAHVESNRTTTNLQGQTRSVTGALDTDCACVTTYLDFALAMVTGGRETASLELAD